MKTLVGYTAGILSLAFAVAAIMDMGVIVGLPFLAAALICLPPVRKVINSSSNNFLTAKKVLGFTVVFVLVGFVLIGIHEAEKKEQEAIAAGFASTAEFEQYKKDEQVRIQAELQLKLEREKAEALKLAAKDAGFASIEAYQEMLEQKKVELQRQQDLQEQKGKKAYQAGDYTTALTHIAPLAEQGVASAQVKLAHMYYRGHGVPQDYKLASKWIEAAATQGLAEAQYALGFMYNVGNGVSQDYKLAIKWYEAAASQGYAEAQANLGVMYAQGKEVSQDYELAVKWTEAAARQGDVASQFNLGIRHMYGQGTPQDDVQAYAWAYVAKANGNKDGGKIMDEVSRQMSSAQLERGQQLGMDLLASLGK